MHGSSCSSNYQQQLQQVLFVYKTTAFVYCWQQQFANALMIGCQLQKSDRS